MVPQRHGGAILSVIPNNRMYRFEGVLAETGCFVVCSVRFGHDNPALRVTIDRQLTWLLFGRGQTVNIAQPQALNLIPPPPVE